jgi:hypothetical protein
MKHLWLVIIVLFISCGKDNKSGRSDVTLPLFNPVVVPVNSVNPQFLSGHWAEQSCLHVDRPGRNGLRTRYEVEFLPVRDRRQNYTVGKFFAGQVEYINRCVTEGKDNIRRDPQPDFYFISESALYTSQYENGRFETENVQILSANEIVFRGKRLIRLKSRIGR